MPLPRLPFEFPPRGAVLAAFCALYLLAGLLGRDLWKGEDATHFGVAYSMLVDGHWLQPHLAGEPWRDTPPLYHWTAAVFGRILGPLLSLPEAARLATAFYASIMLLALAGAARQAGGAEAGRGAVLVTIGCLGLLVHVHESQPAIAGLAAIAVFHLGLTLLPRRPLAGGLLAGAALGAAFLAGGLLVPLALTPVLLAGPLLPGGAPAARRWAGLVLALAVASSLALAWPLALRARQPAAAAAWWAHTLAELKPVQDVPANLWGILKLIVWFAWPALPLAAWTLWRQRRRLHEAGTLLPLLTLVFLGTALAVFAAPRGLSLLPLLPSLVLLAAPATLSLRRGAANAFDWFGMMTFTLLAGLIWLGWVAMVAGVPAQIARNFARVVPGFSAVFSPAALVVALGLTLAWLGLISTSPRSPQRGSVHWAAGLAVCWALLMTLWGPLIDHDRSYRSMAASLRAALPQDAGCIAGRGLGSSQRAALHYFAGIKTVREGSGVCRLLLVQGTAQRDRPPAGGWRKIWEGHRPSDRNERFRLYAR